MFALYVIVSIKNFLYDYIFTCEKESDFVSNMNFISNISIYFIPFVTIRIIIFKIYS